MNVLFVYLLTILDKAAGIQLDAALPDEISGSGSSGLFPVAAVLCVLVVIAAAVLIIRAIKKK